jgi:hypothetical protein
LLEEEAMSQSAPGLSAAEGAAATATRAPETVASATVAAIDATIAAYIETWNETDAARRRAGVARAWADGGRYRDPVMASDGHAGIDAMPALSAAEGLAGVQARFPGFV